MKRFIFSAILISVLSANVYAYSGGSGTQSDPYILRTPADWQQLMDTSSDWGQYFLLAADINLAGVSLIPVGDDGVNFTGVFDGNSNIIRNANINLPSNDYVGLFGYIGSGGQVKNLSVENVTMSGNNYVGGLTGQNSGNIIYSYSTGAISSSTSSIGGLVGDNDGNITNCYSTAQVSGSETSVSVGGLVGENDGNVNSCYSTGTVTGGSFVGGLAGRNYYGSINNCYSTGRCGYSDSYESGGLTGLNYSGTITNCYSTGQVIGSSYVGGLVGNNVNNHPAVSSFWDVNTSDQPTSATGTGKTTAQMKTKSTFASASWDFTNETVNGTNDYWRMCADGVNYPQLNWEYAQNGDFFCPDGTNFTDYSFFAAHWLNTNCSNSNNNCAGTDLDLSGKVDVNDLKIFCQQWLEGVTH